MSELFGAHVAKRGGGGGGRGGVLGQVLAGWVPPQPWDPAFVKEGTVCTFGTPSSVESAADLLGSWGVRHPTTVGGASSSWASWGCWGSMARKGSGLLHTCMHTCTHTCAHTHAHTHMHTRTCTHTHTHAHTHAHTHVHTCTHLHTHTCTHTHLFPIASGEDPSLNLQGGEGRGSDTLLPCGCLHVQLHVGLYGDGGRRGTRPHYPTTPA